MMSLVACLCILFGSQLVFANPSACVESYDETVDYFPDKAIIENAATFTLQYFNSYKVLTVDPGGWSEQVLVLYQCGTPPPTEEYANAPMVEVPVSSISLGSTTLIPFIEALGYRSAITTLVTSSDFVTSPCLLDNLDSGSCVDVTLEYNMDTWSYDVNVTALETALTDVVFTAGYDYRDFGTAVKAGVLEYSELSGAAIIDYFSYFGAFFNAEATAAALITDIVNDMDCIADAVAEASLEPKKVLWCYYTDSDWGVGWDCGECPNYYCDAVDQVGSELLEYMEILNISSTYYLTDEQFAEVAALADVWIYPAYNYEDVVTVKADLLDDLSVFQNQMVFGVFGRGEQDWHESRNIEPDSLMMDLLNAISQVDSSFALNYNPAWIVPYYTNSNELTDASAYGRGFCLDASLPHELQAQSCSNLHIYTVDGGADGVEQELDADDGSAASPILIAIIAALAVLLGLAVFSNMYVVKRMRDENVPFLGGSAPTGEVNQGA